MSENNTSEKKDAGGAVRRRRENRTFSRFERKDARWPRTVKKDEGDNIGNLSTMVVQVAVCAVIALGVLALKYIDTPITSSINATLKSAMTMTVDLDKSLGKLKFVQGLVPETVSVFWQSGEAPPETLQAPFSGKVVAQYSGELPGIEIEGAQMEVYASEEGKVESVQVNEGSVTVIVKHVGGLYTVYSELDSAVYKEGALVKKGEKIGTALSYGDVYRMFFQVRDQSGTIDPLSFIK